MENYFNITENAKNYKLNQWVGSDDVSVWAIPNDEGYSIMNMYEAMAFISSNGPISMIALRMPKEEYLLLEDAEYCEEFGGITIKEEYFLDYFGKILI